MAKFKTMANSQMDWENFLLKLENVVGKKPKDLKGVLFLIGVQELGKGPIEFTKEQKQDLIHIGICSVMEKEGYYELTFRDEDNWPHFELRKEIPSEDILGQEEILKRLCISYFISNDYL